MANWTLYGVFVGSKWGMTTNRKQAIAAAKEGRGYVRSMPYPSDASSWDVATFRVCSLPLPGGDFRPAEEQQSNPLLDLPSAPIGWRERLVDESAVLP